MQAPSEFLHKNRDENSFTARLFEGILFPLFASDPATFPEFLRQINRMADKNRKRILKKSSSGTGDHDLKGFTKIPEDMEYLDGMLFVEYWDLFFCQKEITGKPKDKTEFDCMILAQKEGKNSVLVFEVKCYTDLTFSEIERQRKRLEELRQGKLFTDFYHIGLISSDNLEYGKTLKEFNDHGLGIVTWGDLEKYYKHSRRFSETDFLLPKSISRGGKQSHLRSLK